MVTCSVVQGECRQVRQGRPVPHRRGGGNQPSPVDGGDV